MRVEVHGVVVLLEPVVPSGGLKATLTGVCLTYKGTFTLTWSLCGVSPSRRRWTARGWRWFRTEARRGRPPRSEGGGRLCKEYAYVHCHCTAIEMFSSPLFEAWKESCGGIFSSCAESSDLGRIFLLALTLSTAYLKATSCLFSAKSKRPP